MSETKVLKKGTLDPLKNLEQGIKNAVAQLTQRKTINEQYLNTKIAAGDLAAVSASACDIREINVQLTVYTTMLGRLQECIIMAEDSPETGDGSPAGRNVLPMETGGERSNGRKDSKPNPTKEGPSQ